MCGMDGYNFLIKKHPLLTWFVDCKSETAPGRVRAEILFVPCSTSAYAAV